MICVYAPNNAEERRTFFERVNQYCDCQKLVIIAGDFNCVLSAADKTSRRDFNDISTVILREIVNDGGMEDVGQCLEGTRTVQFTHFQGSSHARLDRIYASLDIIPLCQQYHVTPVSFSDHCLVYFTIASREDSRNNFNWQLWKLNCKLMNDDVFVKQVTDLFKKLKENNKIPWGERWELLKNQVKIKALERSSAVAREARFQEKTLRTNLQLLLNQESLRPGEFMDDIRVVKRKLELIDTERYRGALIRARAERLISGESPTKRALGAEKWHARRQQIVEIERAGVITKDTDEIVRTFSEYYRALFARSVVDIDRFKREFVSLITRLDDVTREALEQPITNEEVDFAIENMNLGKSPGPDGLGAAFYKTFKGTVSPILTRIYNEAYELKSLPPSFVTAHTILIPKSDDTVKLRNVTAYRPISLTNSDYKIFMKVLAKRLQTVISEIVGKHQTCGIKGRSITTNTHVARSILECCDVMGAGVAMLQIDFEKAFDRVPHDALLCVLDHVNVGHVIREGVAMAYSSCTTQLIVNKVVGERIPVLRSLRQGCPISALLFCLYIESFCLHVIASEHIRGFKLQQVEVRLLAYADDIAAFCTDYDSVLHVIKTVESFCLSSGSCVNWGKSLGFWHGYWPSKPDTFANLRFVTTPVKYLGVPLENYQDSEPYWRNEIGNLREKTNNWNGWNLSVFARATVCNLFFISKLWYVMQVIHCSRMNVQKLHRIFAVFVWGSSWERTSRTNLFRRVPDGGLALGHLYLRQIVNRFMFFRDVKDPFLRTLCQVRLGNALPDLVVSTDRIHGCIRGYLKEVVMSTRFLCVRFSTNYLSDVGRKKLYRDLCDVVLPVPLYRSLYSTSRGKDVLKRVKKMMVPPGVKTFFFRLHTGTLTVKTWMAERGLFVPWGVHCQICRRDETIDHVFLECWDAVFLWDILQRTLKKDFPLHPQGIRFLAIDNEDGVPYDLIMLIVLHSVWRCRMAVRNADIDARAARQYFKESIHRYVEEQKARIPVPHWLPCVESLLNMKFI